MISGAITNYIDVAQLALYTFWAFFAGLIIYLRREDKREGYPLESSRTTRSGGRVKVVGFPAPPPPKTFQIGPGESVTVPDRRKDAAPIGATPSSPWSGAPLDPNGNPMSAAVGPGAYPIRDEVPDHAIDGGPKIVPMRVAAGWSVATPKSDPRGRAVVGADGVEAGTVTDLWVDRSEPQVRYLEVTVAGRAVLVPIALTKYDSFRRRVQVLSILGSQFAGVPSTASPHQVTRAEEDRISAYYGAGKLYATPARSEPLV
jgi:photosynthetic reaction center H subunit